MSLVYPMAFEKKILGDYIFLGVGRYFQLPGKNKHEEDKETL
jgi:hypothetical protein